MAGCGHTAGLKIEDRSYSSVFSTSVLAGCAALLGGPLESLATPSVAVSPVWLAPDPFGVAVFPEAVAPGAASPSGPQEEAEGAEDEGVEEGCTLGGSRRLLSKCRFDSCGPKHTHTLG